MKKNSNVSIIIPTYNRAHLIVRAIKSVLNQTYQDFELIIVDDGSTDNTEDIIRQFQEKDKRIRYIKHDKNKGGSAARNTGVKNSVGKYIAFQDSDDEWLPHKLERQIEIIENTTPQVGIVYSDMLRIFNKNIKYFYSPIIMPKDKIVYKKALDYGVANIGVGTALIKKICFSKVGIFDEKFPRLIDLEFFIRLSKYYYFYHIKEPLVKYYDTDMAISKNNYSLIVARKLILKKYFMDITKNKKILAKHYLLIAESLCINEEIKKGESYFKKAFKVYPNLKKEKKLLYMHYFLIGYNLCMNNKLKEGRKFLLKAIKVHPFLIKYYLLFLLTFFRNSYFHKIIQIYQNFEK